MTRRKQQIKKLHDYGYKKWKFDWYSELSKFHYVHYDYITERYYYTLNGLI